MNMSPAEQERWSRVKGRLRAEVGDDVYSSWFARMDLEALDESTVRLSVPTRFLKSWIQSHYSERVLACWQAEQSNVGRIELSVRSGVLKSLAPKPAAAQPSVGHQNGHALRVNGHSEPRPVSSPLSAAHEALGGSPLD